VGHPGVADLAYRSALPVALTEGVDLNQNGVNTDLPTEASAFDGLDSNRNPIVKSIGACTTINCGARCRVVDLQPARVEVVPPHGQRASTRSARSSTCSTR
jgi:hypothetical protein